MKSPKSSNSKRTLSRPVIVGVLILIGILIFGGSTLFSYTPPLPTIPVDTAVANALIPYTSDTSGTTIYYPNGWKIQETPSDLGFRIFQIAPDTATLETLDIPQQGGILSLSVLTADLVGATNSPTTTVASLLELQSQGMADIPGATLTEPTQTYRLGEWEIARQVYRIESTEAPYVSIQTLQKRGDVYIGASAFALETQVVTARPLFDAILSKVTVLPAD